MWTNINLTTHVVWDEILWTVVAIWQDGLGNDAVVMEKSGRCAVGVEDGPDAVLLAAVRALQGAALQKR